jgi:outer membrane protein assembly factor BamD
MKMYFNWTIKLLALFLFAAFYSCSSSNFNKDMETRERFRLALAEFNDRNYEGAIENLRLLSYDRSLPYADSIQYFLAECYFNREQYLLASSEYRDLVRFQSGSKLVPEARYKIALALASISPKITLDQNYTIKAISEFQAFIEYYPTNSRARDAERMIIELRNKLAKKEYDIAVLYQTMSRYKSALVYFQGVLEKYHDSEYADMASYWIIQLYVQLKKINLAKFEIEKYLQKYPNSKKREEVIQLKRNLEKSPVSNN